MARTLAAVVLVLAAGLPALAQTPGPAPATERKLRVLASMVPLYVFTQNVVAGTPASVELVLPPGTGCPHHYNLTPADVAKLAQADVVVVNGLGLDGFVATQVGKLDRKVVLIEAAAAAKTVAARAREADKADDDDHDEAGHGDHDAPAPAPASAPACPGGPGHDHAGHDHAACAATRAAAERNPHAWTSVAGAQAMTQAIADGLAQADPANAAAYRANAKAYIARLEALKAEGAAAAATFKSRRVLPMHDIVDPLCAELGLTVIGVIQEHPGEAPSAARIKQIIAKVAAAAKEGKVALLAEPQYPAEACRIIAAETGQPVTTVDPLATWPTPSVPADAYETVYRANLKRLGAALGS